MLRDCVKISLMSVVADVRGVVQDLIVPDLKALQQRVDSLEKRMDERFQAADQRVQLLEKHMDERFQTLEQRVQSLEQHMKDRFDRAEREAERRQSELISYLSLEARIRRIELEQTHVRRVEPEQAQETHP